MLKYEEAKAILESMLEACTDNPKPDWKDSLGAAAYSLFEAMVDSEVWRLEREGMSQAQIACNCIKCTTARVESRNNVSAQNKDPDDPDLLMDPVVYAAKHDKEGE